MTLFERICSVRLNSTKTWYLFISLFIAITSFFLLQPVAVYASSTCELKVMVTEIGSGRKRDLTGKSIFEIVDDNEADPYNIFAITAEKNLTDAVRHQFCSDNSNNTPVIVDITFLEMRMFLQEPYHGRFVELLSNLKSSYAEVHVDKRGHRVNATFIWNPRRILHDQLYLIGEYEFDDGSQVPSFSYSDTRGYIVNFSKEVVYNRSIENAEQKLGELKGTMPEDLYALLVHSGRTTRGPWGLGRAIRRLLTASQPAYSAIVKTVIERAFDDPGAPPVKSIRDLKSTLIESQYLSEQWSLGWNSPNKR